MGLLKGLAQVLASLVTLLSIGCAEKDGACERNLPCLLKNSRWVDLSHKFDDNTIYWSDDGNFRLNVTLFGSNEDNW